LFIQLICSTRMIAFARLAVMRELQISIAGRRLILHRLHSEVVVLWGGVDVWVRPAPTIAAAA
jgi:hypothetical protein